MITCPHCGKENKDGTSFCRACGKPTSAFNQQPAMPTRMLDPGTMPVPTAAETSAVYLSPQNPEPPPPHFVQNAPVIAPPQRRRRRIWPVLLVMFLVIVG